MKFKIGDRVAYIKDGVAYIKDGVISQTHGLEFSGTTVSGVTSSISNGYYNNCANLLLITNQETKSMNLTEKFALAFKGEPEKSFIKAGVMKSDETLTEDGKQLFMTYLLRQHGDDFKKTVVDPILAEEEKKK